MSMKGSFWIVLFGFAALAVWAVWRGWHKVQALREAEQNRAALFLAETTGRAAPTPTPPPFPPALPSAAAPVAPVAMSPAPSAGAGLAQQKLLFEAAHKAGEAGEPALAIQLFARLLARYPDSGFAAQVRAAVNAQKKKLPKA